MSDLDSALDAVIGKNKQSSRQSFRYGKRNHNSHGINKRSINSRISTRKNLSFGAKKRQVDEPWAHDKFPGQAKQPMSIFSRLGNGRSSSTREASAATLEVDNLHYNVTEQDLRDLFNAVGPVSRCRIMFDRSGRSTGTAKVTFSEHHTAERAKTKFDGVELDGQAMKITQL
ncbi:RNA-binding domain-containing protein [Hesseltinella vesiculosa]|uniref:RNA-binding domain-containing protein n=1 Tax=Hesseltinella vesiculosa TaxID=101127 RepID=A0A1X2GLD1_9FUNG|nr:RNA-binding domain-containing protein [Hesseltinella vesiculosa]